MSLVPGAERENSSDSPILDKWSRTLGRIWDSLGNPREKVECSISSTVDGKGHRVCSSGVLICRGPWVITKCYRACEVDEEGSCACGTEGVPFASSLEDNKDPRDSRPHEEDSKTSVMKGKYGAKGEVDLTGFSN